jgi:hypothetical protein
MKELEKINKIALFEGVEIRKEFVNGEWQFSVIDVIKALTESTDPTNYWSMLKKRELEHGVQLSTFCGQLRMLSGDGKQRLSPFDKELKGLLNVPPEKKEE